MSRAQTLIDLLRLDYRLSDQAIASRCGVSRVHINYVLHGKRQASRELETRLSTLLAECDRRGVQLTRKPNARQEPQKGPRVQPERRASKPSLPPPPVRSSKQASSVPAFVPSPVQAIPVCVACQRPGVRTALYGEKRLCEWCAAARGYSVKIPPASFVPLDAQHMPVERVLPPDIVYQAEPIPETLTSPSAWEPISTRELWAYNTERLCLACRGKVETRSYRVHRYGPARLCEECASQYT
jgi:hypothetical protein